MIKVGIKSLSSNSGHLNRGIGAYYNNLIPYLKGSPEVTIRESELLSDLRDVDLIHYPYFDFFSNSLPLLKKKKRIVTIFDVIPLLFPKQYPPGLRGKINLIHQKLAIKNVDAIITISDNSKEDINKILGIPREKIYVTYLAASSEYKKIKDQKKILDVKKKYHLPDNFFVYVGNVNWNKNIINITRACIDANQTLVLIGKSFSEKNNLHHPEMKTYKEFLHQFENHPLIKILGYIETDDVTKIINLARGLVLVSFYEGFGLPILEAQSCGVPVVTSNNSSMPEVVADSAVMVDPNNVNEITRAIYSLAHNPNIRNLCIRKGFDNVNRFSWKVTAEKTIEVYKKVCG